MSKKNAILLAATHLFSTKGFEGAATSELSRMTGAATGTIFHHFKSKEDLFVHVLKDFQETIRREFEGYMIGRNFENGLAMVEGALCFYLDLAARYKDQFRLLQRYFPYELAETNPDCRHCIKSIYRCLLDIFETGIAEGREDGSVGDVPVRNTAMILFTMVDGVVRLYNRKLQEDTALYKDLMTGCRRLLVMEGDTHDTVQSIAGGR